MSFKKKWKHRFSLLAIFLRVVTKSIDRVHRVQTSRICLENRKVKLFVESKVRNRYMFKQWLLWLVYLLGWSKMWMWNACFTNTILIIRVLWKGDWNALLKIKRIRFFSPTIIYQPSWLIYQSHDWRLKWLMNCI